MRVLVVCQGNFSSLFKLRAEFLAQRRFKWL